MNSAIERLLTLRVRDIMNREVVTIDESRTMTEAAAILDDYDITGAPVVDHAGRCVGVLSASDFTYRERMRNCRSECGCGDWAHRVTDQAPDKETPISVESFRENLVRENMSPIVQTVHESTSLVNAARILCGEHIHRLVIIDDTDRPTGVITSLDIVAAMVAAVEE